MAQKVLINGTAYELKPSPVLIDGTKYQIGGGRTLVNGTGYDVKIANSGYIVTLVDGTTGAMSADYAYATINGVRYISPATVEIHKGDTIQIFVRAPQYNAFVFLNGTIIKKGTDGEPAVYSYEPESNCNLEFRFDSAWGYMSCYITT